MTSPAGQNSTGVTPIRFNDLERLGIDGENQLYWDGRRVEVRRRLDLTRLEKFIAVVVSVCAIAGGIGAAMSGLKDGAEFLCPRGYDWLGCPAPAPSPVPHAPSAAAR